MGISGIIAQILLLRELLVSFLGNELLEAAGSFLVGKTVERVKKRIEVYVFLQIFFSVALPFSIYLCRIFKNLLLATPGEGLGLIPILFSSFLILLPVSLSHGALFTYGCKLHSRVSGEDAPSVGKVYVWETLGSILGGITLTFLLIPYYHAFEIAFILSLLNALISVFLLWPIKRVWFSLRNSLWFLSLLYVLLFSLLLISPLSNKIHESSLHLQWRGLKVVHHENSIYGNIAVTQKGEQFTFFIDGIPSMTAPVPDIASIEDFVHFPMLFHHHPETVLILSGGAGGMIYEVLKYPVKQVDYVELDPLLLKLIDQFSTPLTQAELNDPRVRVHDTDGRFFVQKTPDRFDLIFIGLQAPQELQTNRLFSSEFFSMAQKKMNPKGILVLSLPGSLTYISPELRDLNGCILDTLKHVFQYVRIIPGETNLYLASDSETLIGLTPADLVKEIERRGIRTKLLNQRYIEYRLHERWQEWFTKSMERQKTDINSDFQPLAVFLNLAYWNALFSPSLSGWFKEVAKLDLLWIIGIITAITSFLSLLFLKKTGISHYAIPYAIFTSGFGDMVLDLALIFTFQTFYGSLYHQIGLFITIFMTGIALGSYFMTRWLDKMKREDFLFLWTEMSIILFALFLPLVLTIPSQHFAKPLIQGIFYWIFLFMAFLCGALVGIQFPLATKIFLKSPREEARVGHTAGLLYGADLVGGFLGGLLGGVLLLPLLGLKEACLMVAILKGSSFLLFFLYTKRGRNQDAF